MEKNKNIIEKLKLAQKLVNESAIATEFKKVAFGKVFDYLIQEIEYVSGQSKEDTKRRDATPIQVQAAKTFAGFLRQTKASSHSQKVLAAAYFFMNNDKMTFTKEDVEVAYRESFEPKSKNTNVEINGLIKRGLLMATKEKIDGRKSYQITRLGITYVEGDLIKNEKK